MSTLEVSNLNDGTKTVATTFITNGSAKVWCDWTTNTTTAIRDSFNVSSLTDLGTGITTINYTSSMGSSSYAGVMYTGAGDVDTAYTNFNNQYTGGFGSKTVSSITLGAYQASFVDAFKNDAVIVGDLA